MHHRGLRHPRDVVVDPYFGLMSLHSRTDYVKGTLDLGDVENNPWGVLEAWVQEAVDAGISDPTAFTLSTVDANGFPHGRVVLLRDTRRLAGHTSCLTDVPSGAKDIVNRQTVGVL